MKKLNITIFIIICAIVGALIVDLRAPVSFFYVTKGNILYGQKNFTGAEDNYTEALPYSDDKNVISNNLGNALYKKQNYKDAISNYSKMTEKNDENIFNKSHNLGNAFYKLGEAEKDDNKKIELWKNSVSSYKKALTLNVSLNKDETNKNYLFVLEKLKKLEEERKKKEEEAKKKEEEKKQEGNKSGSGTSEVGKEGEQKEEGENGKQENQNSVGGKTWTNQGTGFSNLGGSGADSEKLTESEKKELEEYLQYLKDFNKQNQQFLRNGTNKPNTMDDMINNFFGNDTLFNQIIPDNSGNKRDW